METQPMNEVMQSLKGRAVEFFLDIGLTRLLVVGTTVAGIGAALAYHYDGFIVREDISSASTSGGDTTTEVSVTHHTVHPAFNVLTSIAYIPPLLMLPKAADADNLFQTIKYLDKAASFNVQN